MMDENLIFNVAQLLKESAGATRSATVVADLSRLTPELFQADAAGNAEPPILRGPIRLMRTGNDILVQGELNAELTLPCSRCLAPVNTRVDIELEELFTPTLDIITGQAIVPQEEDQALWIDEHHLLDLSEMLRQNVLVALPMHLLCRKNCRGLCSTCGQNLNEGTCDCQPEPDPRWAALAALLKTETDQTEPG
jgi:uncharacterized protein